MMWSKWTGIHAAGLVAVISLAPACGSKDQRSGATKQAPPKATSQPTAAADLSTPEAPLQTIFQAAREKNYELYRSAFSDAIPSGATSQKRFTGFIKRVKEGTIEIVPGVERISETEAIVKFKNNKKNKERWLRVRKIGDRWLIVGLVDGRQRGKQQQESGDL
ncbi:MAG: hypothetical protein HY314_15170 [Acidobacteria bacterium]|nr:hypothetical protein [Acidobacteriota bacterium]